MSERDLYISLIPSIADMIVEVQKMPREEYLLFKKEFLAEVGRRQPSAFGFIKKVFIVVDTYLQENTVVAVDDTEELDDDVREAMEIYDAMDRYNCDMEVAEQMLMHEKEVEDNG